MSVVIDARGAFRPTEVSCRVCGCTIERPCVQGGQVCHRALEDLCSVCALGITWHALREMEGRPK